MKPGKIRRLPRTIREQVNHRLENNEPFEPIVEWLNSLPEVQSILASEFDAHPISRQNLTEWKRNGYRDWQMRQSTLEFLQNVDADLALDPALAGPLTEKLARWISFRYAAAAQALADMDDEPEAQLRRLREFCADIVALRRGDLSAGRLGIEQARLAAEQAQTEQRLETKFWEWTKRLDIQAKLYPERDPDQIRRDVVRMVDRELLGIRSPSDRSDEPTPDPAILI